MKPPVESSSAVPMNPSGGDADRVAAAAASPRRPLRVATPQSLTDEQLARRAGDGDRAAFAAIFDRYQQELYRYCYSILRNAEDARDALQSAMLRALRALLGDSREIALRPWLYRIAHNECITLVRRRPERQLAIHVSVPPSLDVEATAEVRAQLEQLLVDLRQLPERQRGALAMRELAGLDYFEIAAALETSPAGAKQAIYEARRTLHELARGRAMECDLVRSAVTGGDGRALRGRAVRAHLRACGECREVQTAIAERKPKLAALAPILPAAVSKRLLESVLAGGGGGLTGAAAGAGIGIPAALGSLTALAAVTLGIVALGPAQSGHRDAPAAQVQVAPVAPERATHGESRRRAPDARRSPVTRSRPSVRGSDRASQRRAGERSRRDASSAGPGPVDRERPATEDAAPAVAPQPPPPAAARPRQGPLRGVRGPRNSNGPVRETVGTVRDTVGSTVEQVQQALPVRPHLPLPPRRKRTS